MIEMFLGLWIGSLLMLAVSLVADDATSARVSQVFLWVFLVLSLGLGIVLAVGV